MSKELIKQYNVSYYDNIDQNALKGQLPFIKKIKVLGPPQYSVWGIRSLLPVINLNKLLDYLGSLGYRDIECEIFCPIHINSLVNKSDLNRNKEASNKFFELTQTYLQIFHNSNFTNNRFSLKFDDLDHLEYLLSIANKLLTELSKKTIQNLDNMSKKHSTITDPKERITYSIAYFLSHYYTYGFDRSGEDDKQTLFLLPGSEERFLLMIKKEFSKVRKFDPRISEVSKTNLVLFEEMGKPYYYLLGNEPTLPEFIDKGLSKKLIFHRKGVDDFAKNEIFGAMQILLNDLGDRSNEHILKKQVLSKFANI